MANWNQGYESTSRHRGRGKNIQWSQEFMTGGREANVWDNVLSMGFVLFLVVGLLGIPYAIYQSAPEGMTNAQIDSEYREMRRNQYEQSVRDAQREAIDQYRAKEGI